MEFPGITAGGGFSGSAGESSSGRHGPFDNTVDAVEIVLPDGEVARASPRRGGEGAGADADARPDLFWGAASAFGTLGVVTLLEIRLRDAGSGFVELTHHPLPSMAAAAAKLQQEVADPAVDFVDGIAFGPDAMVVCSGRIVDADAVPTAKKGSLPKPKPRRYLRRRDPWFYLDVQKRAAGASRPVVDLVPLVDYLFRWDRGGFWVASYAYRYFLTPFNRVTRYLLDDFMRARVMYHALHESGLADTYIIQDVGVPYAAVDEFYRWLHGTLGIYPLWLCPIRVRRDAPDAAHGLHADFADPDGPEFMLNFGVWGPPTHQQPVNSSGSSSGGREEMVRLNRAIERKVHELGGKKTLYAQAYYTEDEFWATYDRPAYDAVRARHRADHLPSVYDKVVGPPKEGGAGGGKAWEGSRMPPALRTAWPFQGLYGVYKAWRGGDYLLQKKKASGTRRKDS
ncbi:hypothetical protein GGR56DRAFT_628067 [Xylariaceae sp. FL0804]|nr:hypothetical protein GGR56DRAFT_628067 [Xylariaceae sp. FL0804]